MLIAILSLLGVLACSPHSYELQSDDKSTKKSAMRLVILGSNLAEMVTAMGGAHQVVGIGAGAEHIEELAHVPVIPGFRNTSAENLLSLKPSAALVNSRQARPELIQQLELSGVTVHTFADDVGNIESVVHNLQKIGRVLNREAQSAKLIKQFYEELSEAKQRVAKVTSKPKGLFILSGGGRPTLVAGENTDIALLIEMAGGQNVTQGIHGFKPMSQEKMLAAAPEFILVNTEGLEVKGDLPVSLSAPGALLTPAGKRQNIITLPSSYLTGLGINTPKAILSLASQIHSDFDSGR
jgi:iron complex transport system substrate-binding protein